MVAIPGFRERQGPGRGRRTRAWTKATRRRRSDLADEVQRRLERRGTFFPLGRAHLARVGGDVLRSLHLAQQVGSVAANALGGDLERLDDALRVDDEGAAVGQPLS